MEKTGQELVNDVRAFLARYVGLSEAQALVLAVWAIHTWVYERLGRTTGYLEITGVTGSGKTTCMEALGLISRGSLVLNTLRTLAMCRRIEETKGRVTFFVDEAERLSSAAFGDQRSMLASGYRRGGVHLVSIGKGTAQMSSYCPKAFTSLRTLVSVLHNRCIPIWMERIRPVALLGQEYERAESVAAVLISTLRALWPSQVLACDPVWLTRERDREIWYPLFAVAATLQLDKRTMDELTAASVDLSALSDVTRRCDSVDADENAKERSYAVRLLADVRAAIADRPFIPSDELLTALLVMPTAPWRSYQQHGLNVVTMARLLQAVNVDGAVKRLKPGGKQYRGYLASAIRDAKV